MSSDPIAIRVRDVSKHYVMFARPEDRLKQMVMPRLQRVLGKPPAHYFKDFAALNGISFDIRRGETVGIVGRNGSGKSTLLQIVCGTLQPSGGNIEVNGRIAALLELGAGFNPEFTGRENVYLNAAILGLPRAEIDARFEAIARFADIGDFIDQSVKTYSSGMYVRLAFATAINIDPDILVVDEALAVGDEAFQRKCFARIEEIKDKGGTILFVSHAAQTIVQLCDRAMLIDGGELILEGKPKLVTSQYQRLMGASAGAAARIRREITTLKDAPALHMRRSAVELLHEETDKSFDESTPRDSSTIPAEKPQDVVEFFDHSLRSEPTVFEERGAHIRDAQLMTLGGEPVNVLHLGKRYRFQYHVDFLQEAMNVGFGMILRTIDGLGLCGAHTSFSDVFRMPHITAGTTVQADFEFSCLVLPGVYYFSCGVLGSVTGEEIQMHRIIDILPCRIVHHGELIAGGKFDAAVIPRFDLQ
jgi:lipopolysaccharide transport system ATP-binding protein